MSQMNVKANVSNVVAQVRACAKVAVVALRTLHFHLCTALGRGPTALERLMRREMMSNPWSQDAASYSGQPMLVPVSIANPKRPMPMKRRS